LKPLLFTDSFPRPGASPGGPDRGIAETAQHRFQENVYLALRSLTCEVADGVLTLSGRVPSYYLKQVAQEAVADLPGVRQIVNAIEVLPELRRAALG
jgi:osmotically-inducible protein OsmY